MVTLYGTNTATAEAVVHLKLAGGPSDIVWFDCMYLQALRQQDIQGIGSSSTLHH